MSGISNNSRGNYGDKRYESQQEGPSQAIGVIYRHVPIDNASIQLTINDPRRIDFGPRKAISPRGCISPRGWGWMILLIGLPWIRFAGNSAFLGGAVAKTSYLAIIGSPLGNNAKSTYHRSRGILPQREGILGTCNCRHIPRHSPAICKEFKHIIRIKPSRLGAEGALRIGHAE